MKGLRGFVIIILLILTGCSGTGIESPNFSTPESDNPVVPGYVVSGHPSPETGGSDRTILAIGAIQLDPETLDAGFVPDRGAAKHWDVTPMLMPPHCNDCVKIQVLEFKPGQKYIKLKVSLKNPTDLTGYDVRGIAVVPSADVRLLNSDGWTELWDDGGDVTRNPFKAFAIDWPDHEIQPGTAHARKYEFTYSTLSQLAGGTQVVIDASWPGNCREAYWFDAVQQEGHIDGETSSADFNVSLTPQDWQGNISTVLIDLGDIGGGIEPMIQSGNDWTFAYQASVVVPDAPRANIWAEVVDEAKPVRAYWLFEIGIVSEDPSLPVPTGINAAPGEVYVDLTWDAIDDLNVVGVNIYRRIKGGSYDFSLPLNQTLISGSKFKDSDVTRNVMYFYVLRTVGLTGSLGPISVEVGAKPFEWGQQFRLSDYDFSDSTNPVVAIGSDGRSRVVWYDKRTPDTPYFDIVEENYTPDIPLYTEEMNHNYNFFPFITTNGQEFYIYATCYVSSIVGTDIVVHRFVDETSLDPEFVHFGNYIPQVITKNACFDLDGNLWIVYFDRPQPSPDGVNHVYVRSISPEMQVSDPILISPGDNNENHPAGIVCDNSGELHSVFTVLGIGQLYYARTIAGVWQPAEQASQFPSYAGIRKQRIDVDSQGRAYTIFASGSFVPEYPFISHQRRDADGWSEHYDIFPGVNGCTGLAIVIDDDDNVNVFHSPGGSDEIKFRRGYNGSWSEIFDVSQGFIPGYPTIFTHLFTADCSSSGTVSLVWEQAGTFIYARRMME